MTCVQQYYTVVQVKLLPIADMQPYAEKLQNALRLKGYPEYVPQTVARVRVQLQNEQLKPPEIQQSMLWHYRDPDLRSGYILSQDHLVFQTTAATDNETLLERLHFGLKELAEITHSDTVQEVGARSLYALCANDSTQIEDGLANGLRGIELGRAPRKRFFESLFEGDIQGNDAKSTLLVRVLRNQGVPGYPHDFQPQGLRTADLIADTEANEHVMFDISHTVPCIPNVALGTFGPILKTLTTEMNNALQIALRSNATEGPK